MLHRTRESEHGGMFHEQPGPGFPSPYLLSFLGPCWLGLTVSLSTGCANRLLLRGLPQWSDKVAGWSEGRRAQLKNPGLLLGFEDPSPEMSLRTPTRPLA